MVQCDRKEDHLHTQAGLQRLHQTCLCFRQPAPAPCLTSPVLLRLPVLSWQPDQLAEKPHPKDRPEGHLKSPVIEGQGLPQDDHHSCRGQGGDHVVDPSCHICSHPYEKHDKGAQHRHACADHEDVQQQKPNAEKTSHQIGACAAPQKLIGADADKGQV